MTGINKLFDQLKAQQDGKRLPPVGNWSPERQGVIDIRIAADGTWYHEGDPIRRAPLVRLFSTVLRRDPDGYWLVTPVEKLRIEVEDAPFLAVDMEVKGQGYDQQLLFTTNVEDHVIADAAHPLRVAGTADQPRPYVGVRDGLEALLARPVYYRLVALAEQSDDGFWVMSAGSRFRLG